jgi:hypothetical protein
VETYRRTGVEPHPRAYFAGIAEEIAPRGNAILWAAFDPSGAPHAYHNDAVLDQGCLYHTGCSTTRALAAGANYLLMWTAIADAKRRGASHFEVGDVFFDVPMGKEEGLTRFKSKFGGVLHRSFKSRKRLTGLELDVAPVPAEAVPGEEGASGILERLRRRMIRR